MGNIYDKDDEIILGLFESILPQDAIEYYFVEPTLSDSDATNSYIEETEE